MEEGAIVVPVSEVREGSRTSNLCRPEVVKLRLRRGKAGSRARQPLCRDEELGQRKLSRAQDQISRSGIGTQACLYQKFPSSSFPKRREEKRETDVVRTPGELDFSIWPSVLFTWSRARALLFCARENCLGLLDVEGESK